MVMVRHIDIERKLSSDLTEMASGIEQENHRLVREQ